MNDYWLCPNCRLPLSPVNINNAIEVTKSTKDTHIKSWLCDNKHSFDVAKEGYVNLLLANQKNSKQPGDNTQMISARRAFLDRGHFKPLVRGIADLLVKAMPTDNIKNQLRILDIGCGEGYYLDSLSSLLSLNEINVETVGIDISKPAIVRASKRMRARQNLNHQFAVASNYNLPICLNSIDICLQVFAPSNVVEVTNVVKNGGLWLQIEPAPRHLYELKSLVYDNPEEHKKSTKYYEHWRILEQVDSEFTIQLENHLDRQNLLEMTPFKWKVTKAKLDNLINNLTSVTASFSVTVLQKI